MQNNLLNKKLLPKSLVVIYADKQEYNFYLESRGILPTDNGFTFGSPVPLDEKTLKQLVKHYSVKSNKTIVNPEIIPEYLLYGQSDSDSTTVVWYRPAQKKVLNFSKSLKLKTTEVHIPATLFCIRNEALYAFALKDNKRPDYNTVLCNAPFFNIYGNGAVCLGTANIGKPGNTFVDEIERYENGFYMAEQNGGTTEGRTKTPLAKLWGNQIKSKKPFDVKELIKHPKYKNLGDFLEGRSDD